MDEERAQHILKKSSRRILGKVPKILCISLEFMLDEKGNIDDDLTTGDNTRI